MASATSPGCMTSATRSRPTWSRSGALFDQYCGLSWILQDADQYDDQALGYNVISNLASYGGGCLTDAVAHEIGHNFGSKHDRYEDDPSDQLTSQFNFGYVDVTNRFMTIMSYPNDCNASGVSCAIIPYHSTLTETYQGHPLGIGPDSAPNAADNTTKIEQIAPYIAQFRSQAPNAIAAPLVDAILPSSRSVEVNDQASFFMTVINATGEQANNCGLNGLQYADSSNGGFSYNWIWQTTDPATNQPTGSAFTPATIPAAGGYQTFLCRRNVHDADLGQLPNECELRQCRYRRGHPRRQHAGADRRQQSGARYHRAGRDGDQ